MGYKYKLVSVYITSNEDIIIIPRGISKKWGGVTCDLDMHHVLDRGYSDEKIESYLLRALDEWNVIEPNGKLRPSVIEKLLKIRGYAKAIQNMRFISVEWYSDEGYKIEPSKNVKNGFEHPEEDAICIGKSIRNGNLAQAFREAVKLCN